MPDRKTLILTLTVGAIIGSILYLERGNVGSVTTAELNLPATERVAQKDKTYLRAKEISTPDGFLNTAPVAIADLVGKQVILVDFWTYSCINCQRTIPHLNSWHEKYKDRGLVILGIHTPEFDFEKNVENVSSAVQKFGIRYPVVLDNDFSTWNAYGNRYWPRKYLIDIDGFIVYDHIGEGAYEETERRIQEALAERKAALNEDGNIPRSLDSPPNIELGNVESPEVYFGSLRNANLGNGVRLKAGKQNFTPPVKPTINTLYLGGEWEFFGQFAKNTGPGARILFRYHAKDVYLVAGSDKPVSIQVLRDGQPVTKEAGQDIVNGRGTIGPERLYHLIEADGYGEHTIEIIIESPNLKAFTFTFG